MTARIAVGVKGPRATKVASLATMSPAFFSPMKAMKKPIPAEIAKRRFFGIQRTICSRMLKAVSRMKMTPSTKTAARPACQL